MQPILSGSDRIFSSPYTWKLPLTHPVNGRRPACKAHLPRGSIRDRRRHSVISHGALGPKADDRQFQLATQITKKGAKTKPTHRNAISQLNYEEIETFEPIEPPWQAIRAWITADADESPTDTPELWDQTTSKGWKTPETDPGDGRTPVLEYT